MPGYEYFTFWIQGLGFVKNSLLSAFFLLIYRHILIKIAVNVFISKFKLRWPNMTALYELVRKVDVLSPQGAELRECYI
jgi:hypothetical protein